MIELAELGKFFELSTDLFCVTSDKGCLLQVNGAFCKALGYRREALLGRLFFDLVHPEDRAASQARVAQLLDWLEVNDRLCDMLGYGRAELQRKTFAEITHPEDVEQDNYYYEQLLSGVIDSCRCDKRYLRSDGESLWSAVAVTALRDGEGQVRSFIAMIQDISDRKTHEQEQAERTHQLRQLNTALARATADITRRNAEWDQFAYVVSHDLKPISPRRFSYPCCMSFPMTIPCAFC
ncbi:MAG: PAS domain S-box protein [Synechococcales cyanobacterium RM1_1_8]|nr:PAS domain S-box protein [Synechococcales cyanobacterium RM1_1_8]